MCSGCSCETDTTTTGLQVGDGPGQTSEYTVTGMTCGHCVSSVTEQIRGLDGVSDVTVDLSTGSVTVTADRPVATDSVAAAVREAGYQLA